PKARRARTKQNCSRVLRLRRGSRARETHSAAVHALAMAWAQRQRDGLPAHAARDPGVGAPIEYCDHREAGVSLALLGTSYSPTKGLAACSRIPRGAGA